MSKGLDIDEYKARLNELVENRKIKCPKCSNATNFMVNELGHVFCNKCYTKIPMVRLE